MSLYKEQQQDMMMTLLTLQADKEEIMKALVGRKIKSVRAMTRQEMDDEGWVGNTIVLTLDNGTMLFASSDEEGNSAGTMYGREKDGTRIVLVP